MIILYIQIEILKILHSAEKDSVSLGNSISSSIHAPYELEDCLLNLNEERSIKILKQIKHNDPNSLALVIWVLPETLSFKERSSLPRKRESTGISSEFSELDLKNFIDEKRLRH